MRSALLIAGKDLRQRVRDRSVFLWGVLAPLGLAAIFSLVFNPISNSEFHALFVVVDEDRGPIAQSFLKQLESLEREGTVTLSAAESEEEARSMVEAGSDAFASADKLQADAAFILPEGLSDRVLGGGGAEMTVIGGRGSELSAQMAYAIADGFVSRLRAVDISVRAALPAGQQTQQEEVARLTQQAAARSNPVSLQDISASTRQLDATTQMTAGMAVFFMLFTVQFGVAGLLEERRLATMSRLLAAPIKRGLIVAGKALTSLALGVGSMGVLVVATTFLLGAHWGDPLGAAMLIVAVVFAAMGILGVVAATARTQEQAANFSAVIALVLGLLGGSFFPVSQVGGILSFLSLLTPHAWFIRGLGDLAGGGRAEILPSVVALLAFGLVTASVSWVFLRRSWSL